MGASDYAVRDRVKNLEYVGENLMLALLGIDYG